MSRLRKQSDSGFTLVEVIVAITVFAIAAMGVFPLVFVSLRAGTASKLHTQAKNLVQEQVERMRNLPFHVDASNGPFRDLLDSYYPNTTAAVAPAGAPTVRNVSPGYVSPTAVRVAGEPAGAFYRVVMPEDSRFPGFRTFVSTQLLDKDLAVLTPPTTYDAATPGADSAPARLVGVTVTTSWYAVDALKTSRVRTNIADAKPATPVINGAARATAVSILGSTADGVRTSAAAGYLDHSASVSTGSTASGKAIGAYIDRFPGLRTEGAAVHANAPADVTTAKSATDEFGKDVAPGGCVIGCYNKNYASGLTAIVADGRPSIGTALAPVKAGISSNTSGPGLSLVSDADAALRSSLMLQPGPVAVVRNVGGSVDLANVSGYLATTSGSTHDVSTGATASVQEIGLLPTTFATRGIVYVTLSSAAISCRSTGVAGGASATATYAATVHYWSAAAGGYLALGAVKNGNTSDPLPAPSSLTVYDSGATVLTLADYIADWTSAGDAVSLTDTGGQYAQSTLDGIVNVTSVDLRPGNPDSNLRVKVGSLSCLAEDKR